MSLYHKLSDVGTMRADRIFVHLLNIVFWAFTKS
jgi:hypothetical protein